MLGISNEMARESRTAFHTEISTEILEGFHCHLFFKKKSTATLQEFHCHLVLFRQEFLKKSDDID